MTTAVQEGPNRTPHPMGAEMLNSSGAEGAGGALLIGPPLVGGQDDLEVSPLPTVERLELEPFGQFGPLFRVSRTKATLRTMHLPEGDASSSQPMESSRFLASSLSSSEPEAGRDS
jgi:hypothetical protein